LICLSEEKRILAKLGSRNDANSMASIGCNEREPLLLEIAFHRGVCVDERDFG
jgi:hypothetical protein